MEQSMGDLSIKNVPEEQIVALRQRAARNHRSLQGELRAIIDRETAPPRRLSIDDLAERARKRGFPVVDEATQWIRDDRDR